MNKKKLLLSGFLLSFLLFFVGISNTSAAEYKLLESVPGIGQKNTPVSFPQYMKGIYIFATGAVIISALLMITIGAFSYITSAGNQARAGTAKKIITDAFLGLVVVFLAYLIFYVINPALLGTSPNLSGLYSSGGGKSKSSISKTYWAKTASGTLKGYNSLAECEAANGKGNCKGGQLIFKREKGYYCANGECTEFDSMNECKQIMGSECLNAQQLKTAFLYNTKTDKEIKDDLKKEGIATAEGVSMQNVPNPTIEAVKRIKTSQENIKIIEGSETYGPGTDKVAINGMNESGGINVTVSNVKHDAKEIGNPVKIPPSPKDGEKYTETQTYVFPEDYSDPKLAGQKIVVVKERIHKTFSFFDEIVSAKAIVYADKTTVATEERNLYVNQGNQQQENNNQNDPLGGA